MNAVPLRRNRDFVLLQTGQLLSNIGTRLTSIAYPLLVYAHRLGSRPGTAKGGSAVCGDFGSRKEPQERQPRYRAPR